ncbi:MAG: hypothetical protein J0M34_07305 [Alphaproteobacteria bacterium]|nr:hypothetical protein [Alphaproteobacteria bacterium]
MKIIHLITLFLVVLGGVHTIFSTLGIDMLGTLLGSGIHMTIIHFVIGLGTVYYVLPMLKSHLASH